MTEQAIDPSSVQIGDPETINMLEAALAGTRRGEITGALLVMVGPAGIKSAMSAAPQMYFALAGEAQYSANKILEMAHMPPPQIPGMVPGPPPQVDP
jgi:hypothetical protein